jgi:hypothetical protein
VSSTNKRSLADAVEEIREARINLEAAQRRLIGSIAKVVDLNTDWMEEGLSLTFLDAFDGEARTLDEQIKLSFKDNRLIGDVTAQEFNDLLKLGELALSSVARDEVTA